MKRAFIFPGQGSQYIGMGKMLNETFESARSVFEEVNDSLNQNLSKILFEGSTEELTLTSNTQPALMAVSIAVIRTLEQEGGFKINDKCSYVAGHSLGEYSALCASGSISLKDTSKLLRIRGDAMQDAVPQGMGSMAALIGVDFETAEEIALKSSEGEICQAANDNGGGQVVLSGNSNAIDRAINLAQEYGIKRAVKLPVSAPFHCELMSPAAVKMQEALNTTEIFAPCVPLIANVTAKETSSPDEIRNNLVKQVTGTVRWRETILYMTENGVEQTIEAGAGKVLSGLNRRINPDLKSISVQEPQDIEELLKLF